MAQLPRSDSLDSDVAALAALVSQRQPTLGRSRLVCVDGPAGSGKTTLAAALEQEMAQQHLSVTTLHMDDLYDGWSGLDRSPELESRLLDQALRPLAEGRPGRWQRYDWAAGEFTEWLDVPVLEVLILEGCGSGALAYSAYISVLVWVEAGRATRVARGVDRDGDAALPHWRGWMESEARHFAANQTRGRSDVVLETG